MKNTITIHRALSKLKTTASRISELNRELYVASKKITDKTVRGQNLDNISKQITSNYDELMDLLVLEDTIKSQVAISNAVTKVIIGGQEMTVVEAISRKNTLETKQSVLNSLRHQLSRARDNVEESNRMLSINVEKQLASLFTNKDTDVNTINTMRQTLTEQQLLEVFDPAQLSTKLEKMAKELAVFQEEVDAILSESNAITTIEI